MAEPLATFPRLSREDSRLDLIPTPKYRLAVDVKLHLNFLGFGIQEEHNC